MVEIRLNHQLHTHWAQRKGKGGHRPDHLSEYHGESLRQVWSERERFDGGNGVSAKQGVRKVLSAGQPSSSTTLSRGGGASVQPGRATRPRMPPQRLAEAPRASRVLQSQPTTRPQPQLLRSRCSGTPCSVKFSNNDPLYSYAVVWVDQSGDLVWRATLKPGNTVVEVWSPRTVSLHATSLCITACPCTVVHDHHIHTILMCVGQRRVSVGRVPLTASRDREPRHASLHVTVVTLHHIVTP